MMFLIPLVHAISFLFGMPKFASSLFKGKAYVNVPVIINIIIGEKSLWHLHKLNSYNFESLTTEFWEVRYQSLIARIA